MSSKMSHRCRTLLVAVALIALATMPLAAGCGGDTTTTTAAPTTETTAVPTDSTTAGGSLSADGAALYAANCGGCHGAAGEGGSAMAIAGKGFPSSMLETVIANGAGAMPGFGGQLQPEQIAAISAYVTGGFQ